VSGPRWFDSHCHIQEAHRPRGAELSSLLAAASSAGVEGLVCVGTDDSSSRQAVALARALGDSARSSATPGVWATVGLHPHEASHGVAATQAVLEEAVSAGDGAVVAVGECGLDYHYDHSPRPDQCRAFAAQIALARRHGLPLVVHTRDAWDDTMALLREEQAGQVVVHCFTGGPDEARRCLDLGACLSFSGIVTFANAQDVRDAVVLCPLDRLMIETDAPFLTPVPHRGRPNQPAYVGLVGEAVAALKGVSACQLSASSAAVARGLFGLR